MAAVRSMALLGVLAALAFVVGQAADLYAIRVLAKPWPVIALLGYALLRGRRPYGRWIAAGLLCSAVGDVLLEISEATFLPGVGAFLLGHLAYVVAFTGEDRRPRWLLALPFAAWGAAVVFALGDGLRSAGMLLPVAVYTAVICAMMWRAAARLAGGAVHGRLALGGALLFAASDTLIAVDRFGTVDLPGVRYAIIGLYWLGQTAIALSARPPDRNP